MRFVSFFSPHVCHAFAAAYAFFIFGQPALLDRHDFGPVALAAGDLTKTHVYRRITSIGVEPVDSSRGEMQLLFERTS